MLSTTLIFTAALLGGGTPQRIVHTPRPEPTRACVSPAVTGTFRVVMKSGQSTVGSPAILVLENIDGCLEVTYVTDESSPVIIDHLTVSNRELQGVMPTSSGRAKVSFKFDGSAIAGTIEQGRTTWAIEGRKTS